MSNGVLVLTLWVRYIDGLATLLILTVLLKLMQLWLLTICNVLLWNWVLG